MMTATIDRDRVRAGLLTASVVVGMGYALVAGLAVTRPIKPSAVMKLFSVPAPHRRETPPPPHPHRAERDGAAAPPNRRSKATPVVLPPPVVPLVLPLPVVAATMPAAGLNATSGASPIAGPGTGAGGQGNGTGSGRSGDGGADGGTPLRRIGGILRAARDIPGPILRDLLATGVNHYVVSLRFTVGIAGRVTDCAVSRSSGSAALDRETCRLIIAKLRYTPELDGSGRPVPVVVIGTQEWTIGGSPPPGSEPDDDD